MNFQQCSYNCQKVVANSSLGIVCMTPTQLSWNSKRPASSASLLERENSSLEWYPVNRVGARLSWCFSPPGNLGQRWQCGLHELTQDRNQSWNDNLGLFCLKIARDFAKAFFMKAALMVTVPVFLKGSDNSNHGVVGPFCHFSHFFVFKRWFSLFDRLALSGMTMNTYTFWQQSWDVCIKLLLRSWFFQSNLQPSANGRSDKFFRQKVADTSEHLSEDGNM